MFFVFISILVALIIYIQMKKLYLKGNESGVLNIIYNGGTRTGNSVKMEYLHKIQLANKTIT